METKDTAVALLKEWKKAKQDIDIHRASKVVYCKTVEEMQWKGILPMEKCEAILEDVSRRLDEIAEAWGITIESGRFTYDYNKVSEVSVRGRSTCFLNLPAREQQAIQEWLLIKNEEKTA